MSFIRAFCASAIAGAQFRNVSVSALVSAPEAGATKTQKNRTSPETRETTAGRTTQTQAERRQNGRAEAGTTRQRNAEPESPPQPHAQGGNANGRKTRAAAEPRAADGEGNRTKQARRNASASTTHGATTARTNQPNEQERTERKKRKEKTRKRTNTGKTPLKKFWLLNTIPNGKRQGRLRLYTLDVSRSVWYTSIFFKGVFPISVGRFLFLFRSFVVCSSVRFVCPVAPWVALALRRACFGFPRSRSRLARGVVVAVGSRALRSALSASRTLPAGAYLHLPLLP